ncbi:hypothetical protein Lal_00042215 [Lupinus albus]|nr:hypothetical protein Lal_00042215 [Lupinus albus]
MKEFEDEAQLGSFCKIGSLQGSQLNSPSLCDKCGRLHVGDVCLGTALSCFHCKEVGHIKRYCPKLRQSVNYVRAERPRSTVRVFTKSGISLLVLFDSGTAHSFVSVECVDRLKLKTGSLPFDLVLSTPTNMPAVVSTAVSRCPVVVNGRTFTVRCSDFGSSNVANFASSDVASFDSIDVASFGSSDVASFGSSDVASFGSSDVASFGSSDVASFGSSDVANFGSSYIAWFSKCAIKVMNLQVTTLTKWEIVRLIQQSSGMCLEVTSLNESA